MLLDDRFALEDMLERREIGAVSAARPTYERFAERRMSFEAIPRRPCVVGEVVWLVSQRVRDATNDVDWRRIVGLRDITVHEYAGMDGEILWDIVQTKVPELTRQPRGLSRTNGGR